MAPGCSKPSAQKIVRPSILNLLDNEFIVIACGGGGIRWCATIRTKAPRV